MISRILYHLSKHFVCNSVMMIECMNRIYFQFFNDKIMYVTAYNLYNTHRTYHTVYNYWLHYLLPLLFSTSNNKERCPTNGKIMYEVQHNINSEQLYTIILSENVCGDVNSFHNGIFALRVQHARATTITNKEKKILCVNINNKIITNVFNRYAHSFFLNEINTKDFIEFIKTRYRKEFLNVSATELTIMFDADFTEQTFKDYDIIRY
jgi:hypothetical protein